jgi:hypothetical protein
MFKIRNEAFEKPVARASRPWFSYSKTTIGETPSDFGLIQNTRLNRLAPF